MNDKCLTKKYKQTKVVSGKLKVVTETEAEQNAKQSSSTTSI